MYYTYIFYAPISKICREVKHCVATIVCLEKKIALQSLEIHLILLRHWTMGAMTILSQQYGSDNGDNRKGLKSVKNSQKNFRKTSEIQFFLLRIFLKNSFLVVFGRF